MAEKNINSVTRPQKGQGDEMIEHLLQMVDRTMRRFGSLVPDQARESIGRAYDKLSDAFLRGSVNDEEVRELLAKTLQEVTMARANNARDSIQTLYRKWVSLFGENFLITTAAEEAKSWLKGAPSGDRKDVVHWIEQGKELFYGALQAPWGRCSCGAKLTPVLFGDQGEMKVFRKCRQCHLRDRELRQYLLDVTRGVQRKTAPEENRGRPQTPSGVRKKQVRHAERRALRREEGGSIGGRGKGKGKKNN